MTTPSGGGTAALVAELRAQAEAAVVRAAETTAEIAREVVEVREQADAVAETLAASAREASDNATAEGRRAAEVIMVEAQATAASTIAEAEAKAASIRVSAAAFADDAAAALARAEVRHESAAVQADALRLTARREAVMHRRQQLDDAHRTGHAQLDAVADVVARLGVTLESLATSLSEMSPVAARLHADIPIPEQAAEPTEPSRRTRSRM